MSGPLVVVGDALLDVDVLGAVERVSPDAPVPVLEVAAERHRPGGAGLAALLAHRDGVPTVLVTALADDTDGHRLRAALAGAGTVVAGRLDGPSPVKARMRAAGQSLLRLDRGTAAGRPEVTDEMVAAVRSAGAVLVADYGRGLAADPRLREALTAVARRVPVVWDPHPRGAQPVPGVALVTPNVAEALGLTTVDGTGLPAAVAAGAALCTRWGAAGVVVTLGSRGAVLCPAGGTPLVVPTTPVSGGDPCGAGDRFAVTVAARLAAGALPSEAVADAVLSAAAFVVAGGAGRIAADDDAPAPPLTPPRQDRADAATVVAAVRARGGTVVATGGCFDLLHVGHARTLAAARKLGDCLVVLLNSDASVRRLKGPDRPVVDEVARAELLHSLACVDAVLVFGEDTPERALAGLRPDLWVKGGDYPADGMPESALVRGWGGQVVTVPYHDGHSSTRLIEHTPAGRTR